MKENVYFLKQLLENIKGLKNYKNQKAELKNLEALNCQSIIEPLSCRLWLC